MRLLCHQHLKSDNLLGKYKAKQFIEIINNPELIEDFDMDLYVKIIRMIMDYLQITYHVL